MRSKSSGPTSGMRDFDKACGMDSILNKKPGVVLILKSSEDQKFVYRIQSRADHQGTDLDISTVGPDQRSNRISCPQKKTAEIGSLEKQSGRGDRIRTCDIWFPKPALYQAELLPVTSRAGNCVTQRHLASRNLCLFSENPLAAPNNSTKSRFLP